MEEKLEKFKTEVLNKYNGSFDDNQKSALLRKVYLFNKKNKTNFYAIIHRQGRSYCSSWLGVRDHEENGKLVLVKNLRGELKNIFFEISKKLKRELNQHQHQPQAKKKIAIQVKLFS